VLKSRFPTKTLEAINISSSAAHACQLNGFRRSAREVYRVA
jgi:hypothetical protein